MIGAPPDSAGRRACVLVRGIGLSDAPHHRRLASGGALAGFAVPAPGDARRDNRQPHQHRGIVVGGHPVVPLEPAAEATVDDALLAARPLEHADGRHRRPAGARAVAGRPPVDVARVQAERAMVAVPAAVQRLSYKHPAAPAAKLLALRPKPRAAVLPAVRAISI